MKHIKVLGITGGVGAGKSTILSYLERQYGVTVIQLDQVAHLLMRQGKECYKRIVAVFGSGILSQDGEIDRKKLGAITFSDSSQMKILNEIVHPAVKEYIIERIQEEAQTEQPFLVIEAALLLEDDYGSICDEIWYIYVDEDHRRERLISSRGYTPQKVKDILSNQMSDAQFRNACQYIIDNSSDILEQTYEQIDKGLKEHGFL